MAPSDSWIPWRPPLPAAAEVLRRADDAAARRDRHFRYVTGLVNDHGVTFERDEKNYRNAVLRLVNDRIHDQSGQQITAEMSATIAAVHPDAGAVAGMLVEAAEFTQGTLVIVRQLAVHPDWERRGLGTVLLNLLPQNFPIWNLRRAPIIVAGGCEPSAARFYAGAGYNVLRPGVELPLEALGVPNGLLNANRTYSSFFPRGIHATREPSATAYGLARWGCDERESSRPPPRDEEAPMTGGLSHTCPAHPARWREGLPG